MPGREHKDKKRDDKYFKSDRSSESTHGKGKHEDVRGPANNISEQSSKSKKDRENEKSSRPQKQLATDEVEKDQEKPTSQSEEITKNICDHTRRCLKARGITKLFPIQEATFDFVMEGLDLIGRALTGSGKTLAFVLPVVEKLKAKLRDPIAWNAEQRKRRIGRAHIPHAVVIAPTRELAIQIGREFESVIKGTPPTSAIISKRPPAYSSSTSSSAPSSSGSASSSPSSSSASPDEPTYRLSSDPSLQPEVLAADPLAKISVCTIYGGTLIMEQTRTLELQGCDIVVATPGRLIDMIDRGTLLLSHLDSSSSSSPSPSGVFLDFFIVDEVDRMLDLGFIPSVETLLAHAFGQPMINKDALSSRGGMHDSHNRFSRGNEDEWPADSLSPPPPAPSPSPSPFRVALGDSRGARGSGSSSSDNTTASVTLDLRSPDRVGPQLLLFSATLPPSVERLVHRFVRRPPFSKDVDLIGKGVLATPSRVRHFALGAARSARNSILADCLKTYGGIRRRSIVFCETKAEANELCVCPELKSFRCQPLHGDIAQNQREQTLASFRMGNISVLVATDVAARGIDIPQVDLIILLHAPSDEQTYVHRSGRTGRCGRSGTCIVFYTRREEELLTRVERMSTIRFERIGPPQVAEMLKAAGRDAAEQIMSVSASLVPFFTRIAKRMVSRWDEVSTIMSALSSTQLSANATDVQAAEATEEERERQLALFDWGDDDNDAESSDEESTSSDEEEEKGDNDDDDEAEGCEEKKKKDGEKKNKPKISEKEQFADAEEDQDGSTPTSSHTHKHKSSKHVLAQQRKNSYVVLARALALIAGYSKPIEFRSLITSESGLTTLLFVVKGRSGDTGFRIQNPGLVWWHLRQRIPPQTLEQVHHMRLCQDGTSAVFDVPSASADVFVSAFEHHRFVTLTTATSLPPLSAHPNDRNPSASTQPPRGGFRGSSSSLSSSSSSSFGRGMGRGAGRGEGRGRGRGDGSFSSSSFFNTGLSSSSSAHPPSHSPPPPGGRGRGSFAAASSFGGRGSSGGRGGRGGRGA